MQKEHNRIGSTGLTLLLAGASLSTAVTVFAQMTTPSTQTAAKPVATVAPVAAAPSVAAQPAVTTADPTTAAANNAADATASAKSGMPAADIVALSCASCHGKDGLSLAPENPALAGQHAAYLERQLLSFKQVGGLKREQVIMQGMVAALEPADFKALAAYYAALPPRQSSAKHPETIELGRQLWRSGNREISMPSCMGCHGPAGAGIPGTFPRLAGQYTEYTVTQLKAFRSQSRTNDYNGIMERVAARMSDKEINALADFIEGLR